jgi:hypothetical protein
VAVDQRYGGLALPSRFPHQCIADELRTSILEERWRAASGRRRIWPAAEALLDDLECRMPTPEVEGLNLGLGTPVGPHAMNGP